MEKLGNVWRNWETCENIACATEMFLNFLTNIFASSEANFVCSTIFPEVGKQGNIDRNSHSKIMKGE